MLCVFSPDCTDFSGNGLGSISSSSALVKETLNGEYELEIVHFSFSRMAFNSVIRISARVLMRITTSWATKKRGC